MAGRMDSEKGHTGMTPEQSDSAETDSNSTDAGETPRTRVGKLTSTAGKVASEARQPIPVPVRQAAGRAAARARHLTERGMAQARQNPRTMAVALAGAAAFVLAAWRRLTRRGQRR